MQCESEAEAIYYVCCDSCTQGDFDCISTCGRENAEIVSQCPCNEFCPNGCPCDGYQCPLPTAKPKDSVLILNTKKTNSPPMITDLTGRADSRGFWFKLEKYTEVSYSCAVNFKGRSYVYGGYKEPYQLSMVDGCALTRVGDLPFPYTEGACTNTPNHVFLCFENLSDYKTCRVSHSATGPFEPVATSLYDHKYIRVAVSESKYAQNDISQCAFLSRFTCRRISLDVATQPGRGLFFCEQRVACYCGISLCRITFRSSSCLR